MLEREFCYFFSPISRRWSNCHVCCRPPAVVKMPGAMDRTIYCLELDRTVLFGIEDSGPVVIFWKWRHLPGFAGQCGPMVPRNPPNLPTPPRPCSCLRQEQGQRVPAQSKCWDSLAAWPQANGALLYVFSDSSHYYNYKLASETPPLLTLY